MKTFILFCSFFIISQFSFAQVGQSLLYEISGNNLEKSSYLFGTFHILNSDYIKSHESVIQRLRKADQIVIETVIDSSQLVAFSMKTMMPGKSLKALIPESDYKLVKDEFLAKTKADLTLFDQFKPALISTQLSIAYIQETNPWLKKYKGTPMDLYFANYAKQHQLKLITFETMLEQADLLFDSDPIEKQSQDLIKLVKERDKTIKMAIDLGDKYVKQDLLGLQKLGEVYQDDFNSLTKLVDDRNLNWMKELPQILSDGNAFIAVGALHLPGENGLIELLIKKGYSVKPIFN